MPVEDLIRRRRFAVTIAVIAVVLLPAAIHRGSLTAIVALCVIVITPVISVIYGVSRGESL